MKHKIPHILRLITALILTFNLGIGVDLPVFADSTRVYNYENFSIEYIVKTEWTGSQDVGITVKNTSKEPLWGWAFEFDASGEVGNVFGAEVYDNDETTYIVKSTTDNNTIEPGETASFSYTVYGSNISEPRAFRLVSKRVVLTDGYSVSIKSNANNKAKFDGSISLKNTQKNPNGNNGKNNTGKNVIDAWTVSFDANFKLEEVERGTFTVDENGRYTITGTGIVSIIRPNTTVQVEISGTKTPNVKPAISNVVVTSVKIDNTINAEEENPNITDITLEAWAEYNENALTLMWTSSITDGNFIIYVSDNGTDFTELATVENTSSYLYTQSFTKKYFKIVQKYDSITVESPIITAEKTSEGYVDLTYYDTDGDGLSDYEESILLTDKTKPDTDTDGLTDYEEVYLTGTDPLVYDSVTTGISDSQVDVDNDSLTNRDEIDRGTNPVDSDSDYDTLNDGEEVNTYGTDPLKFDTDGDGVSDADELQLGLNPTATATNGIPDNERTFEQTLSADSEPMEYINNESELEFSVQITSAGVAENNITASESGYSAAMSNPAIIGVIPEFTYSDGLAVSEFTLSVKIPDSLVQNTVGTYAADNDEFAGIKRLNFFRFFEEINTLLPVETTFDISTNMMYTKTNDLGTYCVMDMEIWLNCLTEGMEMGTETDTESETETTEEDTPDDQGGSLSENTDEPDSIVETMSMNKSVMRTASLSSPTLLGENKNFVTMAETAVAQNDSTYNVIFITENTPVFMNYIDLASQYIKSDGGNVKTNVINNYEIVKPDSIEKFDVSSELLRVIEDPNYDKNTKTYIFLIFDEKKIFAKADPSIKLKNELDDMETGKPYISFISNISEYNDNGFVAKLSSETENKGIVINTNDYEDEKAFAVRDSIIEYLGINAMIIISSTGLTILPTDFSEAKIRNYYQEYKSGNGYYLTDTDGDGLENFKEIAFDSKLIKFTPDMELPTLSYCYDILEETGYVGVKQGYERLLIFKLSDRIMNTRVLPIKSDPIKKDGDNDGVSDFKEYKLNSGKNNLPLNYTQTVEYAQKLYKDDKKVFSYEQNFNLDFSWFYSYLHDPKMEKFNQDLSLASIIYSGLAYHTTFDSAYKISDRVSNQDKEYYYSMSDNDSDDFKILPQSMEYYGFENVETINLREKYTDNDLIQFDIGTHDMREYAPDNYMGTKTKLLSVFVRGTHGTEEWMSNFDIGNTDDWRPGSDWATKANHKGFDVAATRSLKEIHDYMNRNRIDKDNTIIWLAGHSRGGAVSGILATYLINEGYIVYSYNFAPPNQVEYHSEDYNQYNQTKQPASYNGIFNIVNTDDLVPHLPMSSWGFTKYGKTYGTPENPIRFTSADEQEWIEKEIDGSYQVAAPQTVSKTVNTFSQMSMTRNGCYIYEKIIEKRIVLRHNTILRDMFNNCVSLKHHIDEDYDNSKYIYQKPILFMQILAGVAAADKRFDQINFAVFHTGVASFYYEQADAMIAFSTQSGMMKPHYVDAYIIISKKPSE